MTGQAFWQISPADKRQSISAMRWAQNITGYPSDCRQKKQNLT
jgi:hypothetical protein